MTCLLDFGAVAALLPEAQRERRGAVPSRLAAIAAGKNVALHTPFGKLLPKWSKAWIFRLDRRNNPCTSALSQCSMERVTS